MHVPLDEHLHTAECNQIIRQLKACHAEMPLYRQFFGACNKLDFAMRACTKGERLERTAENREKAEKRQAEIKERTKKLEGVNWREHLKKDSSSSSSSSS